MIVLEITMVIISVGAVALSYWLMMREEIKEKDASGPKGDGMMSAQAGEEIRRQISEQWEEMREDFMEEAKDYLSQLSNDKIIGMDEYFGPILERIEKNHEEVVFLYNMLGEKQEEFKGLVKQADAVKAEVHNDLAVEYQKMVQVLKELEKKRQKLEDSLLMAGQPEVKTADVPEQLDETPLDEVYDREIKAIEEEEKREQAYFPKKKKGGRRAEVVGNHNKDIISLYQKGHSVLEISKMLSLGQGEVKFVIDLFQSN